MSLPPKYILTDLSLFPVSVIGPAAFLRALSDCILDIDEATMMLEWEFRRSKGMTEAELESKPKSWWRKQGSVKCHVPSAKVLALRVDAVYNKFKDEVDIHTATYLFTKETERVHAFQMRIITAGGVSGEWSIHFQWQNPHQIMNIYLL
jgi:hypothetical protein